ncbi:MAG: glycosyltransferase [Acidobacteriota bacterium]|nr:glycosyltransferase [Acidobacteriota bacterium]
MSRQAVAEITAILVSWRDVDDIEESVRSFAAARALARPGLRVSLVVVGNGPGSVRADRLREIWPGALVIENPHNRGFGPAANQAAAAAAGDILLFLNPDTRAEKEPFTPLAEGFDERLDAVALAPRLADASGEPVSPAGRRPLAPPSDEDQFTFQLRRLPRLSSDARELLLWEHFRPDAPARRRARYADEDRGHSFPVEQAAGAALAVRTAAFRAIGGFDESFVPAWFEDVDLCARLAARGLILYWPASVFRHAGGVSSQRLGYDHFLPILYANALRYRAKHYGRGSRVAYRALLAAGMLLRLAALPFRPRPPRPRAEAARAYSAVLRLTAGLGKRP